MTLNHIQLFFSRIRKKLHIIVLSRREKFYRPNTEWRSGRNKGHTVEQRRNKRPKTSLLLFKAMRTAVRYRTLEDGDTGNRAAVGSCKCSCKLAEALSSCKSSAFQNLRYVHTGPPTAPPGERYGEVRKRVKRSIQCGFHWW